MQKTDLQKSNKGFVSESTHGSNIEKMGKINVFFDFSEGFRNVLIFNVISGLNFLFSGFFTKKYIANNQNINNIRI